MDKLTCDRCSTFLCYCDAIDLNGNKFYCPECKDDLSYETESRLCQKPLQNKVQNEK